MKTRLRYILLAIIIFLNCGVSSQDLQVDDPCSRSIPFFTGESISGDMVILNWDIGNYDQKTSFSVELVYGLKGFDLDKDSEVLDRITVNAHTFTVFGLDAGVTYDFYVKLTCQDNSYFKKESITTEQEYFDANLRLARSVTNFDSCDVPQEEKDALIALYNATDGANWKNNTNWLSDKPVCEWFGVTVSNNRVVSLKLRSNNLTGVIPNEIGNLTGLKYLELYNNNLSGQLPQEFNKLVNLININISKTNLSGTLDILMNCTKLVSISIYSTEFTGAIPSTIENLKLLKNLYLGNNKLTGVIPREIGSLTNLNTLALFGNKFSPSIIPQEFSNLKKLSSILLQSCNLTGEIPSFLGSFLNLQTLWLHSNNLSSTIPEELGSLPKLSQFLISRNAIQGEISIKSPDLKVLRLSYNRLVFSDLEKDHLLYKKNLSGYIYSNQSKVDKVESLSVEKDGSITLTSDALKSSNNSYQWYKDGVAIPNATSKEYVISNAKESDAGSYYFTATNSIVTGLTLTRNTITLAVTKPVCPDSKVVSTTDFRSSLVTTSSVSLRWDKKQIDIPPTDGDVIPTDPDEPPVLIGDVPRDIMLRSTALSKPSSTYEIIYGLRGFDISKGEELGRKTTSNSSITIEGLNPNLGYDFYIKLVCQDISLAVGPLFIQTKALPAINIDLAAIQSTPGASFRPMYEKKYVVSGWVKEQYIDGKQVPRYTNSAIRLSTIAIEGGQLSAPVFIGDFYPKGAIIEGWQRIEEVFVIQTPGQGALTSNNLIIELINTDGSSKITTYFDDVRIFPFNGSMKSFVYDDKTKKLMAELDENNYATFYEYDQEGGLVRVKKETERGVFTIQETRSSNAKKKKK